MIDVAYHEAGHAVAWLAVGVAVKSVSITPLPEGAARCRLSESMGSIKSLPLVVGLFASTHAVRLYSATTNAFDQEDRWMARVVADGEFKNAQESARWLEHCDILARARVSLNAAWIHAVADALLRRRSLSGEEVEHLKPRDASRTTCAKREERVSA